MSLLLRFVGRGHEKAPGGGGGGGVAPTVSNTSSNLAAGNANSVALTFASNVTAGRLAVVGVSIFTNPDFGTVAAGQLTKTSGTATIGTVTLDTATTAERAAGGSGGQAYSAIYSVPITGSGSLVLTYDTGAGGTAFIAIAGVEVASVDVSGTRVNAQNSTITGTGVTSFSSGSVATGGAGIIFGLITPGGPFGTQTLSTPTNYTLITEQEDDSQQNHSFVYRSTTTDITDGPTWSIGTGSDPVGVTVAYKSSTP